MTGCDDPGCRGAVPDILNDVPPDNEPLRYRIAYALAVAERYGQMDGADHKAWAIDRMVRALTGDLYDDFVESAKRGEDGPDTYAWDVGIAP
jgi:hypothetical protein